MCIELDPEFSRLRRVEALTAYAVELRYPDDLYFPSVREMHEAEKMAALAEVFISERFAREGVNPRESGPDENQPPH